MLQIIPIPAFKDNYIWLIHNGSQAIVVDPGDATPVIAELTRLNLALTTILITHHHHDHIGGMHELLKQYPTVTTYAPRHESYGFEHHPVSEPDVISLPGFGSGYGMEFSIIDVPGHTLGHIAYYANGMLLCGDTLFGAGCGRLFEGTAEQLYTSLQKLAQLPKDTKIYCTHEYTLHNIQFALTLEPGNIALVERKQETEKLRNASQPSLPSDISLELATNPFLRCNSPEILMSLHEKNLTPMEVFRKLREMRNHY